MKRKTRELIKSLGFLLDVVDVDESVGETGEEFLSV
jgi:hypothetical protein